MSTSGRSAAYHEASVRARMLDAAVVAVQAARACQVEDTGAAFRLRELEQRVCDEANLAKMARERAEADL